jgi:hypothetical protein
MLKAMQREMPEAQENSLAALARKSTIVSVNGINAVFDTGKTVDPEHSFSVLASDMSRLAILLTSRPISATKIYWLYEGNARLLVANAAEAAGFGTVEADRQKWIDTIQNAKSYPTLAEMHNTSSPALARYGERVVTATTALAVEYLAEKTSPNKITAYFSILRDLGDGSQAFQQAFGMPLETFESEFAGYLKSLGQ